MRFLPALKGRNTQTKGATLRKNHLSYLSPEWRNTLLNCTSIIRPTTRSDWTNLAPLQNI